MFRTLAAFALIAAALPALAQQAEAPADNGLSMGQPVAPDGGAVGTSYVATEYGDFDLRCVRTESGKDPCQLYQLLSDTDGNAVAEFTLFPLLPPQGDAIAGGTIVTPLLSLISPLPQAAVLGTSLLAMLPPSAVALAQHYRQGLRSLLGSPGGPPLTPENWIPKL